MKKLLASDVIYAAVARPEIKRVLADNGIEGEDPPESVFLPDETKWLDEDDGQLGALLDQRRRRRNLRRPRPRAARDERQRDRTGRRSVDRCRPRRRNPRSRSRSPEPGRIDRERGDGLGRPSPAAATVDQTISADRRRRNRNRRRSPWSRRRPAKRPSKSRSQPVPGEEVTDQQRSDATPSNSNRPVRGGGA